MSLRFVIGRSGTGKTTLFLDEIKEKLMNQPDGHPVLYIVPEQMTFLSEYRLVNTPGLAGMIRTQVFSFTRLAWKILQETGGASRNHISSIGLNMLIRKIIEDNKDDLKLFKKAADKKGFIEHIERMLTEFKHYCIFPEDLSRSQEELSFKASTRALADKLHDLELIYHKFEQTLIGKYTNSNDYLNLLADSIKDSSYLKDAEIYIDGFHNFTPQEKRVIEQLMKYCKRTSIALVLDRPYKNGVMPDDLNLFRITGETYSDLYKMASENSILLEEDVFLADTPRFQDEGLQYLQARFDKRPIKSFHHNPAIEIRVAANRRAEVESIAREIRRLVREEGYHYNDIAVLVRNGQEYQETMETVFHDYEIPFFIDQKRPMLNHPLIELIRSSLDILRSNWRYEPVFRAIKTDLLFPLGSDIELLREQMDRLENYVLAHGIKGDKWLDKNPWRYKRFFGLEHERSTQTDAEKKMEAEINESRNLVVLPLLRFSRRINKAKNGRELCEAVYLALEELDIPNKLAEKSNLAEEKGQLVVSREHDQAWGAVIDLLDQFVEVMGDEPILIETFIDILDSGLEAAKFSLIPPAIDQVFIADLELSRLSNIKASFVIGLNDGVIPAKQMEEGTLSDEDRSELNGIGLHLAPGAKTKLLDEDFVAYRAFTIQEQRLYLSYPLANDEGKGLLPFPYIKKIKELFPEIKEFNEVNEPSELLMDEQFAYVSHPSTAIAYLTAQLQLKTRGYPIADFWWDVYNFYMEKPKLKQKAKRILSSLFFKNETKTLSEKTSKELYGDEMLASVSRMELFHGCPFSHFTSHGLRLREREIYRLDAPHIGDLFHAALKWISEEVDRNGLAWSRLTKEQCEWLAKKAVEQFAPKLQNQILLSSNRHFYIKRKLEQIIGRASYVLSSHAKVSGFSPVGLELDFGPFKQLPPLAFTLKSGTKMQLQGRIDRVDKAEDENGVYLRVIDYKSSSRALDLNEVYHGLALQMLTYLDIIITHSNKLIGTEATPAGVLYFHVHNPMITTEKLLTLEDIENEILKEFKMKGLLLGDPDIIRLMDNSIETGTSNIISASINKDGSLSARSQGSSASEEDFKTLRKFVRNLYEDSGNRIIQGDVNIDPYKLGDRTPCQFCSYKSVCQFDQSLEDNRFRVIPQQNSVDVLARIERRDLTLKTVIPIKPEHVTWTDDQWKAIMAKDQDILVAAAAGSGKTAVLVERIIQKILTSEDPLNIDQLLVVTFTNASAAEMRHRIGEALEKAIDQDPLSSHLRRQLGLLNSAAISTLHSFCLDVVRKYYYMIDIDPGFRIADQTEADLLRDEVLDELFETEYGKQENESFYHLVDTFTNDRNDSALQELVLKLYDFSRSHPDPFMWLDQIVDMYDVTENTNIENLPFIDILKFDIQLQLSGAKGLLEQALNISKTPGGPAPRAENYIADLAIVEKMERAAAQGWDSLYETMNNWSFSRAKPCKGDEYDPDLIKEADELRKAARGMLDKLSKELFSKTSKKFLKDMQEMKQVLATLVDVVKKFSRIFEVEKADKGLVDFSDLEHLCLEILMEREEGKDEIIPSEIALNYRNQFKEVLVDEYQDTNMVQETIIKLVTTDGEFDGNLFMVGDVKQSIYRFRLAEPNLFFGKYLRFTSEGENSGLRIDLSRNFRSRAEVLDGVNYLFKQIMGTKVGEIEYNRDAELVKGSGYPNEEAFPIEVTIIDQSDEESIQEEEAPENVLDQNELEQTKLEARYMADTIRKMIDEENPIYELKTKGKRPVRYKDIVILVRSLSWAPDIMEEFKHAGIPVHVNLSTGYFDATEVAIMMSLLKIIDNPDQDIPLAAVLRSPIIGLSEDELAHIRLQSRKGSYYEAVKMFISNIPDHNFGEAWEQVSDLFNRLHEWRSMARSGALSELIWQLYRDTGFYEFVGGLPGGKQRQANLRAFYDRARQYENTSFRGLFRFLRFVERMRERGNDLGAARALGEQEDVVRIMTIHSSKGLEFPVVFVAGTARKFNMRDLNSSYMFDKEFGFASKYVNTEKRISYSSLPQLALRRKKKMELLSEEMRVLYVALTRAKEKLFLVASVKNIEKEMKKWLKAMNQSGWLLSDHDRAQANSYLDWIGIALIRHRDAEHIRVTSGRLEKEIVEHPSRWKVEVLSKYQFDEDIEIEQNDGDSWQKSVKKGITIESESTYREEVNSRLAWEYAFPLSTKRMSKQSVSEIKRMFETRDEASATQLMTRDSRLQYDRPKFMSERGVLSSAERGTAMHTVMQHIPLDEQPTLFSVEMVLEDLIQKEIITIEQAEVVSSEQIVEFFESEIGQKAILAEKVHREVPFTMGIPAREVYSDWDGLDEKVLVQGIIDCIIEEQDGVILLDYKTDAITGRYPNGFSQAKKFLFRRYETQLKFYEQAITEIWKKPVIGKYLYFFDAGEFLKL